MGLNGNRFKISQSSQPCPKCLGYPTWGVTGYPPMCRAATALVSAAARVRAASMACE